MPSKGIYADRPRLRLIHAASDYAREIEPKSMIDSDRFASADGLFDVSYNTHFRVNQGNHACVSGHRHSNGMKEFWGVCPRHVFQDLA